jgi:hypothetical protein
MIVTTILFATLLAALLLEDRAAANDAPAALASQVAAEIAGGQSDTIDAQPHVDLSRSSTAFVVVEDAQGRATAGSGYLRNALVSLPNDVLAAAAKNGRDDATLSFGERSFATVTLKAGDGFVSAGQPLAAVDARAGSSVLLVGIAWLVAILVLCAAWFRTARIRRS